MFEAYTAAIRLSQLRPVLSLYALSALKMPELGYFKLMEIAKSLTPDDGLTYVQRLFREHSKNKNRNYRQHRERYQDSAGADNEQQHAEGKGHAMPEQWSAWPLRAVELGVLNPGDSLSEPVTHPIGD